MDWPFLRYPRPNAEQPATYRLINGAGSPNRSCTLMGYHHFHPDFPKDSCCYEWSCYSQAGPDIKELRYWIQIFRVIRTVVWIHGIELCLVFLSFAICWKVGAIKQQVLDSSYFKSTGLLLAVMLSLRARNAVGRRQDLQIQVLRMINAAKSILEFAGTGPGESHREDLVNVLALAFADIALWLQTRAWSESSSRCGCTMDSSFLEEMVLKWREAILEQATEQVRRCVRSFGAIPVSGGADVSADAPTSLCISPRPLLLHLREICDFFYTPVGTGEYDEVKKEYAIDKISNIRRWHKNIDLHLQRLVDAYDELLIYYEEAHSKPIRWLISSLIFFYVGFYPWAVSSERSLILGATTLLMAMVFYGLNALAQELEEPLSAHSQGVNLGLTLVLAFDNQVLKEEWLRGLLRAYLDHTKETRPNTESHQGFMKWLQERGPQADWPLGRRGCC